jgi:hypothetical protein
VANEKCITGSMYLLQQPAQVDNLCVLQAINLSSRPPCLMAERSLQSMMAGKELSAIKIM